MTLKQKLKLTPFQVIYYWEANYPKIQWLKTTTILLPLPHKLVGWEFKQGSVGWLCFHVVLTKMPSDIQLWLGW